MGRWRGREMGGEEKRGEERERQRPRVNWGSERRREGGTYLPTYLLPSEAGASIAFRSILASFSREGKVGRYM
jgi:hypothetical protein